MIFQVWHNYYIENSDTFGIISEGLTILILILIMSLNITILLITSVVTIRLSPNNVPPKNLSKEMLNCWIEPMIPPYVVFNVAMYEFEESNQKKL